MATSFKIWPEAAFQSPLCQFCSTIAITFCWKIAGTELMSALKIMQTMTNGSITG